MPATRHHLGKRACPAQFPDPGDELLSLPDMHTMVTGCSRVFLFLRTLILQEYDVAGVVAADITIHIWNHAETVVAAK